MAVRVSEALRCLQCLRRLMPSAFTVPKQISRRQSSLREAAYLQTNLKEVLHTSDTPLFTNINKDERTAEEKLAELNEEEKKRLKVLKLEHQVMTHMGERGVPDAVKDEWWVRLLSSPTISARKKLYRYFNDIEKRTLAKRTKREQRLSEMKPLDTETEQIHKPVTKNTIFFFLRDSTMDVFYNSRLVHSLIHGPYLIIDIGFEDYMNRQENTNLLIQLQNAYGTVRKIDREPFYMLMCNIKRDGQMADRLCHHFKTNQEHEFLFTVTEKSYLDLFPKERLVYLTPDAPNELTDYNPDDVYIVGGFIDKSTSKPLTLAKAKEQKLRMAKLPLDRYLKWRKGSKYLTLNQVIEILSIWKMTNNWEEAFKVVPSRKLAP